MISYIFEKLLLFSIIGYKFNQIKSEYHNDRIYVKAIGRVAFFGELYDARLGRFLNQSVLKTSFQDSDIQTISGGSGSSPIELGETLDEKFDFMKLKPDLKFSILSGQVELKGIGRYFNNSKTRADSIKVSMGSFYYDESERFNYNYVKDNIDVDVLKQTNATHIVYEIQLGRIAILSIEDPNMKYEIGSNLERNLWAKLKRLFDTENASSVFTETERKEYEKLKFELYCSKWLEPNLKSIFKAREFYYNCLNDKDRKPLAYSMVEIDVLRKRYNVAGVFNSQFISIDRSYYDGEYIKLFNDIYEEKLKFNDIVKDALMFKDHIWTSNINYSKYMQLNFENYISEVKKNLSDHLFLIRSGNESIDILKEIWEYANQHALSPRNLRKKGYSEIENQISILKLMINWNVTLLDEDSLPMFLWDNYENDAYILFYSKEIPFIPKPPTKHFADMIWGKEAKLKSAKFAVFKNESNPDTPKISLIHKGQINDSFVNI